MTCHYNTLPCLKTLTKPGSARTEQALAHRNLRAALLVMFYHTGTKDLLRFKFRAKQC